MLEKLRKLLGLRYARFQFRNDDDTSQQLTDFVHRANNILIVLPLHYDHAVAAGTTLKKVFDKLHNAHLTIITSGIRATALNEITKSEVVRLDDIDINKWFLPRRSVLQRVLVRKYDIAVDLNLDFVLHAAYICKVSRAPIRVGIASQASDRFFNIQFNLNRIAPPQATYEKFAQYLAMF